AAGNVEVVDDSAVERNLIVRVGVVNADIGISSCEGRRGVVNITAALLVVNHGSHGHLVGYKRNVDDGVETAARSPLRSPCVARVYLSFKDVQFRFVGDVT